MRPLRPEPGGSHRRALWTDDEAENLRKSLKGRMAKGHLTYKEVAEELGCCAETVRSLVNRQRYRG